MCCIFKYMSVCIADSHKPALVFWYGKQRARKSLNFTATAPRRHLLLQSNWLFFMSVTASPAFCPLLLVDRQRHSSPHLFHASFGASDSRRIHEAGLRSGCRFLLERVHSEARLNGLMSNVIGRLWGSPSPALKPLRCPYCSPTVLFPPWSECGLRGAVRW